jgi:hypothetical protein
MDHTTCRMLIQGFTLCVQSATDIGDLQGYSARVCALLDVLDAWETACRGGAQGAGADLERFCDKADSTNADLRQTKTRGFPESMDSAKLSTMRHRAEAHNAAVHTRDMYHIGASDLNVAQTPPPSLLGEPCHGGSQLQGIISHGIHLGEGDISQQCGVPQGDKHVHTWNHDNTVAQRPSRVMPASRQTCQTDAEEGLCMRDLTVRTPSGVQLIRG